MRVLTLLTLGLALVFTACASKQGGAIAVTKTIANTSTPVATPTAVVTNPTREEFETQLVNFTNLERLYSGLRALRRDASLTQVARSRSEDMAQKGYFSHIPPGGCNFICLMDSTGVAHAWAGENLARNSVSADQAAIYSAILLWQSLPHRDNTLNQHYTRFGIGYANDGHGNHYFTIIFEGNNCAC